MRIACETSELNHAMSVLLPVTARPRCINPILTTVKATAADDTLTLVATDLEIGASVTMPCQVQKPGQTLLPAARFAAICKNSTGALVVESDGDARNIVCLERSKFTLAAENPADFPTLPDMEHESNLTLPGDTLGKMIRRTLFATDNDSSRYALGGLLFENDGKGHVHVVATDGRRMAKVTHDTDGAEQSCIVPSRTAKIIASAIKGNEPASFSFDGAVWFRHNGTRIYSRFMESRFPKWRDVIPSKAHDAHTFELPVEPIATAVRHAAIVMDAEQACGVEFSFKEGMLTLDALNVEVGQALVQVPIQDGPTVSTCLDYRYVADFLAVLDSETFLMTVRDEDSAVLLEQGDYQYVVMPLTRGK